ncbi:MAG TPA: Gfo/Idh/MocA family oxidoreductase [Baekduia sp.]|nr:Gfo/Idh/MocA family oxidoreductase [Baekduia sp.]
MTAPIRLAVVGLGYWGPNLVRNAWEIDGAELVAACDRDADARRRLSRRYPGLRLLSSYDAVLAAPDIDAVLLATPVATHFSLARRALLAGKHVFVEKPMTEHGDEAEILIAMARERGLVLMPGHTFLYSPPVRKIKELIEDGQLGDLYFGTFSRVNLGIHQSDASVIRDLAPHDLSMLIHWFGRPVFVRAVGRDSVGSGQLDVAFLDLGMPSGAIVHLELSWLSPTKLRRTVLVGSRRMVVYDDVSAEQVRVFDRGVDRVEPTTFGEHQLSYRSGDVLTPHLEAAEPLRVELEDFVGAISEGRAPVSTPELGLAVVRVIEAAERSLAFNGVAVPVDGALGDPRAGAQRRLSAEGGGLAPLPPH